jgi:Domain of unknown function (DUF4160)
LPELSRFFGIIIRMFFEMNSQHHKPHFHAYHAENVAIFSIHPVFVIAGSLPKKEFRLVQAWAELHQDELLSNWHLLQNGKTANPIKPLN